MPPIGGASFSCFVAAIVFAATGVRALAAAPVADALVPANAYFAGRNVAIGDCVPAGMLGPRTPCDTRKGSVKFLFVDNLEVGDYALEIEYQCAEARPIFVRVDAESVTRALEDPAPVRRWARAGIYRLEGGVFTTVEIESIEGFPAIGAVRLTKTGAGEAAISP